MKLYRGYKKEHFELIKNNITKERSFEYISSFDDIVYAANKWFSDIESYVINKEALNSYLHDKLQLAYSVQDNKFMALGVNACTDIQHVTQFYASPDADIIVCFAGKILSDNLGGDGYIAKIEKIIEIIEL